MNKESFILHTNMMPAIKLLSMEQRGLLLTAIFCSQTGDDVPDLDAVTAMAFAFVENQLQRDNEKYNEILEKRRAAGHKGGVRSGQVRKAEANEANACFAEANEARPSHNDNDNVNDNDNINVVVLDAKASPTSKKKAAVFKKPAVEEVRQYCKERGNDIDADTFWDYYEANGWRVGRTPMKDWKAAVRTWERKNKPRQSAYSASFDAFDRYVDSLEGKQ